MATVVFQVYDDGSAVLNNGDLLGASSVHLAAGDVSDTHVAADAGIDASKLEQTKTWFVNQEGTAADRTFQTYIKGSTGTLHHFTIVCGTAPTGSNSVTVDLHNDGVSVLSAPVTLNSGSVAHEPYDGTISSVALADGDRLAVVINETQGGTPAQDCADIGVRVDWDEDYAS